MTVSYYYNPGYAYAYYTVDDFAAINADADTDMGNMTVEEFHRYFPHAIPITEEQYTQRSVDPVWAIQEAGRRRREGKTK